MKFNVILVVGLGRQQNTFYIEVVMPFSKLSFINNKNKIKRQKF